MSQIKNNEISLSSYGRYMSIAAEACDNAKKSASHRNALVGETNIDHEKLIKAASDVHDKATIAIVFSAMAIEAFINEYGISNFSSSYFKNHLDNLSLVSKLVIIPKIANKLELDKSGQVYQEVKWLIELRNHLVHFRFKKRPVKDIDMTDPMLQKDFVMESHSERAVKAMSMLIESLKK
ncbi:MAG: hypothetical protein PHP23_05805 [Desulfobacterales bacterium]|nr:hypothetical protein [Desulfobacterales bacterium]MDD4072312.1 hypothetical protein [Desulfobacterales bacterium]MDD4391319.1 hypothetical protein [Desulfobacterales bacterium]